MTARQDFLLRLALTSQLADERAEAYPNDGFARTYAEAARLLFLDVLNLPEGHDFFEKGAEDPIFPLVKTPVKRFS